MTRHEFMSPAWIAMARDEISRALSGRLVSTQPFSLSEEFTHPPPHLRQDHAETIGFTIRVEKSSVEVSDRPTPNADCRIISRYDDALALGRNPDVAAADPAEAERRIAEGRLRIEGDPSRIPPALQQLDIHRLLAEHTL